MPFSFGKKDKLKSKKIIDALFSEGKSISAYPLRLVYLPTHFDTSVQTQTGVSVSKRHFKKAVDRNRIKRLMREAYRLNRHQYFNNISTQYALMILYIGNEKPNTVLINTAMDTLFENFSKKIAPK